MPYGLTHAYEYEYEYGYWEMSINPLRVEKCDMREYGDR